MGRLQTVQAVLSDVQARTLSSFEKSPTHVKEAPGWEDGERVRKVIFTGRLVLFSLDLC